MFHEISQLRFWWATGCAEGEAVWKYGVGGFPLGLFVFSGLVMKVVGGEDGRSWLLPPAVASPAWERLENKKMRNFFCHFASMRRTVPVPLFCYKFVWCYEVAGEDEKGGFGRALVTLPFLWCLAQMHESSNLRSSATLCKTSHVYAEVTLRYFSNLILPSGNLMLLVSNLSSNLN